MREEEQRKPLSRLQQLLRKLARAVKRSIPGKLFLTLLLPLPYYDIYTDFKAAAAMQKAGRVVEDSPGFHCWDNLYCSLGNVSVVLLWNSIRFYAVFRIAFCSRLWGSYEEMTTSTNPCDPCVFLNMRYSVRPSTLNFFLVYFPFLLVFLSKQNRARFTAASQHNHQIIMLFYWLISSLVETLLLEVFLAISVGWFALIVTMDCILNGFRAIWTKTAGGNFFEHNLEVQTGIYLANMASVAEGFFEGLPSLIIQSVAFFGMSSETNNSGSKKFPTNVYVQSVLASIIGLVKCLVMFTLFQKEFNFTGRRLELGLEDTAGNHSALAASLRGEHCKEWPAEVKSKQNLSTLDFKDIPRAELLTDQEICTIIEHSETRNLILFAAKFVKDAEQVLHFILHSSVAPTLISLELSHHTATLSSSTVRSIADCCPLLQKLSFEGCPSVMREDLEYLVGSASMSNLQLVVGASGEKLFGNSTGETKAKSIPRSEQQQQQRNIPQLPSRDVSYNASYNRDVSYNGVVNNNDNNSEFRGFARGSISDDNTGDQQKKNALLLDKTLPLSDQLPLFVPPGGGGGSSYVVPSPMMQGVPSEAVPPPSPMQGIAMTSTNPTMNSGQGRLIQNTPMPQGGMPQQQQGMPGPPSYSALPVNQQHRQPQFNAVVSTATGRTYFVNMDTMTVQWEPPPGFYHQEI